MARSFVHRLDFTRCLVFLQIDSLGPPLSFPGRRAVVELSQKMSHFQMLFSNPVIGKLESLSGSLCP